MKCDAVRILACLIALSAIVVGWYLSGKDSLVCEIDPANGRNSSVPPANYSVGIDNGRISFRRYRVWDLYIATPAAVRWWFRPIDQVSTGRGTTWGAMWRHGRGSLLVAFAGFYIYSQPHDPVGEDSTFDAAVPFWAPTAAIGIALFILLFRAKRAIERDPES
jgi:hypothetical protein